MTDLVIKEFNNAVPPLNEIKSIFEKCNWWKISDDDFKALYESSSATYLAYKDDQPIGTGRIITDSIVYALFVDILVIPEMQRKGVGKILLKEMLSYCKRSQLKMIKLLATSEGKVLYEKLGFKVRGEHEPGMLMFVKDIKG